MSEKYQDIYEVLPVFLKSYSEYARHVRLEYQVKESINEADRESVHYESNVILTKGRDEDSAKRLADLKQYISNRQDWLKDIINRKEEAERKCRDAVESVHPAYQKRLLSHFVGDVLDIMLFFDSLSEVAVLMASERGEEQ